MFRKGFIFSAAALLAASNAAYAGCVQTFGVGSSAKAQAEAVTALANDPFAVYYNPAGLVQIDRPMVSATANLYDAEGKVKNFRVTAPQTGSANLMQKVGSPETFHSTGDPLFTATSGFAMPVNDKWSVGVAGYSPYGLRILWNHNYKKNSGALYSWESTYYRTVVSPAAAYKINDKLSAGFGISLGHSIADTGKTFPVNALAITKKKMLGQAVTAEDMQPAELKLESADDFNYSFNVGLLYKPDDKASFGITYRSVTNTDFEGNIYYAGKRLSDVEMKFDHPDSVQAGFRYRFLDNLAVETDLVWTKWDINRRQIEKLTNFSDPVYEQIFKAKYGSSPAFNHDRSWENTVQYKIGAEWNPVKDIAVRCGYTYDPTPVPEKTFEFGWPDTDRSIWTAGLGWTINSNWSIDTACQYIRSTPMRTINESNELDENYGQLVNQAMSSIPAEDVKVSMEMEGLMVAYSFTVNYRF